MSIESMKFRPLWLLMGYLLIALVLYLSLTSDPIKLDVEIKFQDKFFHALAYFSLTFWFAQIYRDKVWRYGYALMFFLMGVGLEYLQSFDPKRSYELADMAANATGVVLGLLLALTSAQYVLLHVDRRLNSLK